MKKLNLEIKINASQEKVWDAIVNVSKYRIWTAAFNEGSFFEGGWNKGDTIRFIGLNEAGEKEGMISEIAESIYPVRRNRGVPISLRLDVTFPF